jgi:chromosomal replication initiation ATPase DnaA
MKPYPRNMIPVKINGDFTLSVKKISEKRTIIGFEDYKSDKYALTIDKSKIEKQKDFDVNSIRAKILADKDMVRRIREYTAYYFDVSEEQMTQETRGKLNVSKARHVAIYISKQKTEKLTLAEIGEYFNRDHASVIHAIEVVNTGFNNGFVQKEDINHIIDMI